jgi:hypothetical protein
VLDDGKLFSKEICCEAMKELAARTGKLPQDAADETAVNAGREING